MRYQLLKDKFKSSDGVHDIAYRRLIPAEKDKIKGVFQIAHGMCDYFDRYMNLAAFMVENGYVVCGNDHLGHGHSVNSDDELGYFSPENGWQNAVDDMHTLTNIMKEEYPDFPYILFGHSMGSFFSRAYQSFYKDTVDGLIICGTNGGVKGIDRAVDAIEAMKMTYGDRYRSEMIGKISLKFTTQNIQNPRTGHDCVSRDEVVVDRFESDPKCNFIFTLNGYENLIRALEYVSDDKWYDGYDKNLPTLIISGDKDPVGNFGKGPYRVFRKLSSRGCKVSLKLYGGARHELHNEINNGEIFSDILMFADNAVITKLSMDAAKRESCEISRT